MWRDLSSEISFAFADKKKPSFVCFVAQNLKQHMSFDGTSGVIL